MKTILRLTTTALLAAALFTTACSDEGGPKDWSVATLESQTVTLGGTSVKWTVPGGLSKNTALSGENSVSLESELGAPSVSLKKESIPPASLAAAVDSTGFLFGQGGETLEQREDGGRFVVALADAEKHRLMVAHFIPTDGGVFQCLVSQSNSGGVPNFDGSLAKFHEICNSVKAE